MAQSQKSTPCSDGSSSGGYPAWAPHGVGLSAGYNFAAGVGSFGAAKTGSYGGGQFFSSNTGPNQGTFTTGTLNTSSAYLASASGGGSVFLTNAQSAQELTGPFTTDSLDIGVGPFQTGFQLSYGGGIWQFGWSPPFAGLTFGLSYSEVVTNTALRSQSSNGCTAPAPTGGGK